LKALSNKAVCIASGESLTKEDVDYCRGKATVFVVNDCYKIAPWADYLYACDEPWWDVHHESVKNTFKGESWSLSPEAHKKYDVNLIGYNPKLTWSLIDGLIATGGNSGFQVLNMADLIGFDEIILLGYDMGYDHKSHWFGDHEGGLQRGSNFNKWIKNFRRAKPLIQSRVVNCTRKTRLDCFEKADLREVL
jgi:hypothetical protein